MNVQYRIVNRGAAATGVVVSLARTQCGRARVVAKDARIVGPAPTFALGFRVPVPYGGRVAIEVSASHILPGVRAVRWLTEGELPAGAATARLQAARADHRVSMEQEFVERLRSIESEADPDRRRAGRFFHDLDFATHPGLARNRANAADFDVLEVLLMRRIRARAKRAAGAGNVVPAVRGDRLGMVRGFSRTLTDVLRQHFLAPAGYFDVASCCAAFEQFANGELVTKLPAIAGLEGSGDGAGIHGGPDSALYFALIEFAIAAHELGVDTDTWRPLIPGLVRSAEVMAVVYHGPGRPRRPQAYSWCRRGKSLDDLEKVGLRRRYAGVDSVARATERFGEILLAALWQEYGGRTPSYAIRRYLYRREALAHAGTANRANPILMPHERRRVAREATVEAPARELS